MPRLVIVTRNGTPVEVDAQIGDSVLNTIKKAGIDEIYALCGGACACGTCHAHFETNILEHLGPMSVDENELLDAFPTRSPGSRLSCQVPVVAQLEGSRIVIADEM